MTVRRIKSEEIRRVNAIGRKIIVSVAEIFGEFEVMVMYEGGEEIECYTYETEEDALIKYNEMVLKYANDLQKALYNKMENGKKYTLVYFNGFGFPVAVKMVFDSMKLTTYAQYSDVMEMIFKPYRKRNNVKKYFYNSSIMIFEGWQELKEEDTHEVLKDNESVRVTKSKYACFDSRYIEDLEKAFNNAVVTYKNYKVGKNGKVYA